LGITPNSRSFFITFSGWELPVESEFVVALGFGAALDGEDAGGCCCWASAGSVANKSAIINVPAGSLSAGPADMKRAAIRKGFFIDIYYPESTRFSPQFYAAKVSKHLSAFGDRTCAAG
jgi:hypothetical protein